MSSNKIIDLSGLKSLAGLSEIRYFPSVGSTNDEALAWATEGAKDFSLVIADEQIAGRGRMGRKWHTPPGAALALSLIIRPRGREREAVGLFSGLGALALVDALRSLGLTAQIKWPNDVLINRKKMAGILVETVWMGADVDSIVLGMGVNVTPESIPPSTELSFPATCVHSEGQISVSRSDLLKTLLAALLRRRSGLTSSTFVRDCEAALAFRGETVNVWVGTDQPVTGQVLGLETDGSLRLKTSADAVEVIHFGEVHLRPA
jgi:BirA family transcriptional regulator, biotin operon repressor / biotin---[acetyl-CoA-carboxylase] ligase